jgi:hypothetical protein
MKKSLITEHQVVAAAKSGRPNISERELDRDLVNLHLPEANLIASDDECAAMYPKGVYASMVNSTLD